MEESKNEEGLPAQKPVVSWEMQSIMDITEIVSKVVKDVMASERESLERRSKEKLEYEYKEKISEHKLVLSEHRLIITVVISVLLFAGIITTVFLLKSSNATSGLGLATAALTGVLGLLAGSAMIKGKKHA